MGKKSSLRRPSTSESNHGKDSSRKEAQTDVTNKPRNLLVTDATTPFTFYFSGRFGIHRALTVNQTAAEETWPGGALWDLGVLLSQVLVAISSGSSQSITLSAPTTASGKSKSAARMIQLPSRLAAAVNSKEIALLDASIVLELGCGVGLTGLVAAAALQAKTVVLTDLAVVIDQVTRPNVELNSVAGTNGSYRTISKGQAKVVPMPLCWGSSVDEERVRSFLVDSASASSSSSPKGRRRRRKSSLTHDKGPKNNKDDDLIAANRVGVPDVVLIGDVAYQHKPGAPSHFDDLLSTLLKFSDSRTVVIFGTRLRMPASADLLNLLLQHFDELVNPPVSAEEIDSQFAVVKHNMSVHFLTKKKDRAKLQHSGESVETLR